MSTAEELTRDDDRRRSTPPTSSATCSPCPSTCATRCGGWSRRSCRTGTPPPASSWPAWAARRSAGALARAALGDHASRPIFVTRAYGLPTWTTPDTMVLLRELLRRHRGDARLLRVGRRARRQAHGRHHRGAAGGDGPRRRRSRDPAARRLSAARGGRLHDRRRARGRRAVRRRPAADLGDRRRRLPHRAARRRVGPGRARGLAGQGGSPAACTGRSR